MVNFRGSKLKIERAKHHIADLENKIRMFSDLHAYSLVVQENTGSDRYLVKHPMMPPEVPDFWSAIIGDTIHNLRTALDHLACDLVRLNGVTNVKNVCFPFCLAAHGLEKAIKDRNIDWAAPDVVDIFRTLKPYHGGNQDLRDLHDFDVCDKHQSIIPVNRFVNRSQITTSRGTFWISPILDTREDAALESTLSFQLQMELHGPTVGADGKNWFLTFVSIPGTNFQINEQFSVPVQILFGEGLKSGKSVLIALEQFAILVDGIVQTFEAHCY